MICKDLWNCCNEETQQFEWCSDCKTHTSDSNISRTENRKRYNLLNPTRIPVVVFKVDGGVIRNEPNQPACDYLFVTHGSDLQYAIFVELKGSDVSHAVEQITKTIDKLVGKNSDIKYSIQARIVCRAVPNYYTRAVRECKKYLGKEYGADLHICSNTMDDSLLQK